MQQISNDMDGLQDFIGMCKIRLKKILERLEWTEELVQKNFNSNSIASSITKERKKICPPKIRTFPSSFITQNSLILETSKLQELLKSNKVETPRNFEELQACFTREQKLKIYQHVIENTKKLEHNLEVPISEGEISLADIVAQKKREEKRKKRKFRKSKPTHIEEVRCLINLQMQALRQFLGNRNRNESQSIKSERKSGEKRDYRRDENKSYCKWNQHRKSPQRSRYRHDFKRSRSRGKDLPNTYRKRSRSLSRGSQYEQKRHDRSCDRKRSESSHSKEHTYKRQSFSYDRDPRYHQSKYKSSREKSNERKRESRDYTKSPERQRCSNNMKYRSKIEEKSNRKRSRSCDRDKYYRKKTHHKHEYLSGNETDKSDSYRKSSKHKSYKSKRK